PPSAAAPRRAAQRPCRPPSRRGSPVGPLFDHLIGPQPERRRDREPEGFGGLEVDDQLELGGLLHGHVGGLGGLEEVVPVPRRSLGGSDYAAAVRHQSAPPSAYSRKG